MSILDSAAQFYSRANELGLSQTAIDSLKTAGISTLGHLAFAVGASPTETTPESFQLFGVPALHYRRREIDPQATYF